MENESSNGKKYKIAGYTVAVVLIILAVIVSFLGSIKITKKPKVTKTEVKQEVSQESGTSVTNQTSSINNDDLVLKLIKNEDKLNYDATNLATTGVISNKSCYLQDNQVIYLLDISIGAGASTLDAKYYCPYDTYMSVSIDDLVTVNYKQVSNSTFAIMSVTK